MTARLTFRQWMRRGLYFFPLQLLLLHLKKNHFLLLAWVILFGYVTESLGVKYGVPNLFLYPEYFGKVGFFSYALTGFALGGFITAFNLYSYAMHAFRFPFIATLSRPFLKFNVNNALIPVLFTLTYLWCSARFQYAEELLHPSSIILHLAGFLTGIGTFLGIALIYFTRTNTDIIKLLGREPEEYRPTEPLVDIIGPQHDSPPVSRTEKRRAMRWLRRQQHSDKWRVETYLTPRMRIMLARSSAHYDQEVLRDVLWQNHINGSFFELALVLTFILLGAFADVPLFAIPAGASAFLFFTMLLMIISALFSWMHGWTGTVIIGVALTLNLISHRTDKFLYDNQAYGLDYSGAKAPYDQPTIAALAKDTAAANRDRRAMLSTLGSWKAKNMALAPSGGKPPLVIITTSGGGLRSLLWTFRCLQHADSLLGGTLMDRTMLMTGSSGGLIGATYYRQLVAAERNGQGPGPQDPALVAELSSDMLNPIAFHFVTNDMFVRYRKVHDDGHRYTLDRAYAFEQRLHENTRGLLDVRLDDLADAERRALIPLLVMSPTSINDGRRLVIGALPMAFLTNIVPEAPLYNDGQPEAIEFQRLFAGQDAGRLRLGSALRMNATFPYITPVVSLPSEPAMRVMDAGIRDNYGYRTMLVFLHTFRDWIAENTSGVVILQLRDTPKALVVQPSSASLFARVLDPVGSVYDNFVRNQDQDYDLMLQQASGWADFPVDVIDLELQRGETGSISLNWHLTALERKRVLRNIDWPTNRAAFERLARRLGTPPGSVTLAADADAPAPARDPVPRP